jgi:hypothetical protein
VTTYMDASWPVVSADFFRLVVDAGSTSIDSH